MCLRDLQHQLCAVFFQTLYLVKTVVPSHFEGNFCIVIESLILMSAAFRPPRLLRKQPKLPSLLPSRLHSKLQLQQRTATRWAVGG